MKRRTLCVGVALVLPAAALAASACSDAPGGSGGSSSSAHASSSSTSTSTTSGTGSDGGCPVATMGCAPGTERYLGPCGSYCGAPFAPSQGALTQTCDASGTWGPSQCMPPSVCGSSASSSSSSGGGGCATPCDGGCANEMVDPQNCGACGHACAANEVCTNGACSCPKPCGAACPDLETDSQNCGACGTTCASGESCSAGTCVLAWTRGLRAGALAIDGSTLFLSSFSTGPSGAYNYGRVYAAPAAAGGSPTLLYDDPDMDVRALAADASFVYALDVLKKRVLAIPRTGGGLPLVLASGFTSASFDMALGGGYVFWSTASGLLKAPLACGATTVVRANDQAEFYPGFVATNASEVYWTGSTDDIFGAPFTGGTPDTLATYTFCFGKLAADADRVYCLTQKGIAAMPVGGGAMQDLVTGSSPSYQSDLAVDGTNLYWADMSGIMKAPIAGGSAAAYASPASPTGPLAIDATYVYWAADQGVVQTPK